MTTAPLHIALKQAVDDLGMDILKSPMLVNILTDYRTFDVHDPMLKEKKDVINTLVTEKYYDKISEWRKKTDSHWESEDGVWLNEFCKRTGLKSTVVEPIADTMKMVVGLTVFTKDYSDLKGMSLSIKKEYLDALERLIQVHTDYLNMKTAFFPPEAMTQLYLLEGKLLILAKDPNEAKKWIESSRLSVIQNHSTSPQLKKQIRNRFIVAVCLTAIVLGLALFVVVDRIIYSNNKSVITTFKSNVANGDEALKNDDPETALSFYIEAETLYTSNYHPNKYKKIASAKQQEAAQKVVEDYSIQIFDALHSGRCTTAKDLYEAFLLIDFPDCIDKKSEAEKFNDDIYQYVTLTRDRLLSSISTHKGKATSEEKAIIEELLHCYPDDYYLNMIKNKMK